MLSTRRCADRVKCHNVEVSFVDFLLGIAVYPDDPRYSCLMKHDACSEPAGPETNLGISVRSGRGCSSGGDRPASRLAA